jgi:hypothetical protein
MGSILQRHKVAVITAITGGKDKPLRAPSMDGADYLLFTDLLPQDPRGWTLFQIPRFSRLTRPDRRNAKLPKVMPFMLIPQYDFVIWQDGGHMIQIPPQELVQKYLIEQDKDVAAFMHGRAFQGQDHNCIYKEAENIKNVGFLEDPEVIDEQVAAYRKVGYPEDYGLSCNAAMIWSNIPQVHWLQLTWWEQICRYSSRDQMSFFYSLWNTSMKDRMTYIDGHWERNEEIPRLQGHANARK